MAINCQEAGELGKLLGVVGNPGASQEQILQATTQIVAILSAGSGFAGDEARQSLLTAFNATVPRLVEPWVDQVTEEHLAQGRKMISR